MGQAVKKKGKNQRVSCCRVTFTLVSCHSMVRLSSLVTAPHTAAHQTTTHHVIRLWVTDPKKPFIREFPQFDTKKHKRREADEKMKEEAKGNDTSDGGGAGGGDDGAIGIAQGEGHDARNHGLRDHRDSHGRASDDQSFLDNHEMKKNMEVRWICFESD